MYNTNKFKRNCYICFLLSPVFFLFVSQVNATPTASFTFSPNNQCGSVPINFTNTSVGGATYLWNFGDANSGTNNTSTDANPTHRFVGNAGNGTQSFTVILTVTASDGTTAPSKQTITIKQNPGTQLSGPNPGTYNNLAYFKNCTGSTSAALDFSNSSSTVTTNTSYRIVWGDNTPDYVSPTFTGLQTHTYITGTYPLLFIVTGQNGCVDTGFYYIFIGSNPGVGFANQGNSLICSGTSLTFPISQTASNNLETTYTVTFNDGTQVLQYNQPPPSSVTHTFNTTSCGVTSLGYPNSFSATIVASNACLSTTVPVAPIYVSQKPQAAITVSPNDTVCVNNTTTFTNTSSSNSYINPPTCTAGKLVWGISPALGWTLNSGNFGTDNGSTNPGSWSSAATSSIGINFNTVGTYTVRLKTGNPNCGQDSTTQTICVNPAPIGGFTLDNTAGCTPLSVSATNTSNSPVCGSNTYAWSVSYSSTGCVPNTSNFTYINGTTATSANPQFQFINPGTYTISLVTKSSGGACTAAAVTKTVTVKAKPTVTITAAATTCQNVSISPTATINNCYSTTAATYSWSFPGATPFTSTLAAPGAIVYNTVGSQTITLTVTNECGPTTITKAITVNPTPFAFVPPNQTYCAGIATSAITLTSNITGTTFTWTNSNTNIGLGSGSSGNIPSFTTKNTGTTPITGTIKVTPINGCNGPDTTFTITVNPTPAAPVVTAAVSYCQGASAVPLIATQLVGDTLRWYTTPTGGTPSPTTPTLSTTTVGATTYYVSQVNSSGCESARSTIKVTVTAGTILSNATVVNPSSCASATGSIVLPGLTANTSYKVTYTKNGTSVTINITSDGSGKITIPSLTSGTYDNIQVTPTSASTCPSNIIGPYSLVDPNPPATPTATSNSPLCAGEILKLSASSSAPGTPTYNWSGPNGFNISSQNPNINNITTAGNGNYSVTITVAGCTSAAATIPVTINPIPTGVSTSSNSPICIGDTLHLTASSNTPGIVTYAWTGPNNFASPPQSTDIPNATLATGGTYLVTASVGNCSASAKSITVTVNSKPIITDSSFANPSSCGSAQGSISLKGLASNKSYVVNYVANGAPITSTLSTDANGTLTISNLVAGTYTNVNVALASGGCTSNLVGPFILVSSNVSITVTAGSNSPICSGSSLNLIATANIAGATFSWTGPNGFTSTSPNPTINNATSAANGPYTVIATANGCSSSPSTIIVAVSSSSVTANAGPAQQLCNTSTTILAANSAGSGTGTWKVIAPSTATVAQINNPTSSINNLPIGITKVVWAIAGSCLPSADTMQITNLAPLSNAITPASSAVCIGQTSTLIGNTPTGGSGVYYYQWQQSTDGIIFTNIAGAISLNYTALPTVTTYYRRSVSSGACTSNSDTAVINISSKGLPTVYAGTDVTICKGQSIQLSAIGASTFAWYPTQGLSCSTCAKPVASPNFTTNYILIGDNGQGCTGTDTVTVNVIQPLKLYVSANDTICVGQQAQLLATNADKYIWNPSIGLDNSTIANPIAAPTFTIPYRVIGFDANNCFSDTGYVLVAVGKYPTVDFGTKGGLVTAGTAIQFSPIITNGPITTYRWTPTQYLSCTNCSNPLAIINKDVTYILEATNIYGCKGSDTISYKITCESGQVFIANAFTPDNDGVNDVLVVQGSGIAQVKYFRIFNRWGQLVFERSNFAPNDTSNGWDGKINGKLGNPEVYVYTAEVICSTGNTFMYKGNVTLIR